MTPAPPYCFTVRLAPATANKLAALAEDRHASRRYVIESLIREAWGALDRKYKADRRAVMRANATEPTP